MKIAFFSVSEHEKESVLASFPLGSAEIFPGRLDEENLPARNDFEIISVFVDSHVTQKVLDHFPNLKHIAARSTGFDHIDTIACAARGVSVSYVPGYGDNTVAEFAFGLLLALTRKIYRGANRVKESGTFSLDDMRGIDLKGRTMGIIGVGRIGKESIRIAQGFGMNVLAYDIFPDVNYAAGNNFVFVPLDELLSRSDVISVHAPLTSGTQHLINTGNIAKIKKGCILINTARGPIVETDALFKALNEGILAGAGLDVLEEEGDMKDEFGMLYRREAGADEMRTVLENHVLIEMPNVLITPHMAFDTDEALTRILNTTFDNIRGFEAGQPVNLVPVK